MIRLVSCSLPFSAKSECTILLHGLARTKSSFNSLEKFLNTKNQAVISVNYPSRKKKIEELAKLAISEGLEKCHKLLKDKKDPKKINFVTHSMGGIILRYYLSKNNIEGLERVVMLSPPNKGSELVDKFQHLKPFSWLNGPAGKQLGSDPNSFVNKLGPVNFDLGVIAGTKSLNPLYSSLIPGDDDGKVSVESTKVEGMKDFIKLPVSHSFMMNNKNLQEQVWSFLSKGRFDKKNKLSSKAS